MINKFKLALQRSRPISISLSPNVEKDDVKLALNLLIRPWKWKLGKEIKILEEEFAKFIGVKYAISFNSGRSSLFAILQSLKEVDRLEKNSNVLLQAFTCNASINPVLWAGLNPIYVDCSQEDFNMDIDDLTLRLASLAQGGQRPKALIVQHTFGQPANMKEVVEIAKNNNLILIEDCAHSLGASYNGKLTGTFGRAGFFSFSRDKIISSVYGGMAVTNDDNLAQALRQIQGKMSFPNLFWIMQQLLHPILLYFIILPFYNFLNLGKVFLIFAQITHILSKAVNWKEKQGSMPDYFPRALPNALAILALNQFTKLDKFYNHRKKLYEFYVKELAGTKFVYPSFAKTSEGRASYLRFSIKHPDAHKIIYDAWHKENILIGDWYTTPIAPFDTSLKKMHYKEGDCLNAEILAETTLNLPTHINITQKDADKIINFLKKYS